MVEQSLVRNLWGSLFVDWIHLDVVGNWDGRRDSSIVGQKSG